MAKIPSCHPDRPHHAHGLCLQCYGAQRRPAISKADYHRMGPERRARRLEQMRRRARARRALRRQQAASSPCS